MSGRRWLAMHGKDEGTHRPFYGKPVKLNGDETPYSWLPGTGANLMPRNGIATEGGLFAASMVTAVQIKLIEVAAIAVVPCATKQCSKGLRRKKVRCVLLRKT